MLDKSKGKRREAHRHTGRIQPGLFAHHHLVVYRGIPLDHHVSGVRRMLAAISSIALRPAIPPYEQLLCHGIFGTVGRKPLALKQMTEKRWDPTALKPRLCKPFHTGEYFSAVTRFDRGGIKYEINQLLRLSY